jgi:uncharacterized protein YecT (DUF1311 family)
LRLGGIDESVDWFHAGEFLMGRVVLVLLFGFMFGCAARADDAPDCDNQVTQMDMTACAGIDYEKADAELNAVWKEAKKKAEDNDVEHSAELKGEAKALLAAQRGWIAYRDGHCAVSGFEARGGSLEPMLVALCRAEMTRARTQELQDYVKPKEQ